MSDRADERRRLIDTLKEGPGAPSDRALAAMARVPRELFLPEEVSRWAYRDEPVPIGEGQTASAPHMVAMMLDALDLAPGHRVLEVGGGSGYHAAVAAELVRPGGRVLTMELLPALATRARSVIESLGYGDRVQVVAGDGALGFPEAAPYDRIWLACAAPHVPPLLLDQLRPGGRIVAPLGGPDLQELVLVQADATGRLVTRPLGGCRFVPLVRPPGALGKEPGPDGTR